MRNPIPSPLLPSLNHILLAPRARVPSENRSTPRSGVEKTGGPTPRTPGPEAPRSRANAPHPPCCAVLTVRHWLEIGSYLASRNSVAPTAKPRTIKAICPGGRCSTRGTSRAAKCVRGCHNPTVVFGSYYIPADRGSRPQPDQNSANSSVNVTTYYHYRSPISLCCLSFNICTSPIHKETHFPVSLRC